MKDIIVLLYWTKLGIQWIRNCNFIYRTFGLVNQDDSPDWKKIIIFFNISLLMAGLYSFVYLYKAFFIVIDIN